MKLNNALIIGKNTKTTATGEVARVCQGEYVDAIRQPELRGNKIYLDSLLCEGDVLDRVISYCRENKPSLIVRAGDNLYDAGTVDLKYGVSPVMLLYKAGLLDENCSVMGGICLERDEVDLMAAVGAKLIVCPTYLCGSGSGIPIVTYAAKRIPLSLGTFDNRYNIAGDVMLEAKTLYFSLCGIMKQSDAIALDVLMRSVGADDFEQFTNAMNVKL